MLQKHIIEANECYTDNYQPNTMVDLETTTIEQRAPIPMPLDNNAGILSMEVQSNVMHSQDSNISEMNQQPYMVNDSPTVSQEIVQTVHSGHVTSSHEHTPQNSAPASLSQAQNYPMDQSQVSMQPSGLSQPIQQTQPILIQSTLQANQPQLNQAASAPVSAPHSQTQPLVQQKPDQDQTQSQPQSAPATTSGTNAPSVAPNTKSAQSGESKSRRSTKSSERIPKLVILSVQNGTLVDCSMESKLKTIKFKFDIGDVNPIDVANDLVSFKLIIQR